MFRKKLRLLMAFPENPKHSENSRASLCKWLKSVVLDVPDFPSQAELFSRTSPRYFSMSSLFTSSVRYICQNVPKDTNKIAAIDARGFLIASPVAIELRSLLPFAGSPGSCLERCCLPRINWNMAQVSCASPSIPSRQLTGFSL